MSSAPGSAKALRAEEVRRLGSAALISEQLDKMTEEQLNRFEFFFRSHFSKNDIKDILCGALGEKSSKAISDELAVAVGGLAKLFVGEVVETALEVSNQMINADLDDDVFGGEIPALKSEHIREAIRRMQCEGKISSMRSAVHGSFLFDNSDLDAPSYMDTFAGEDL